PGSACLVNPVDKTAFDVALAKLHVETQCRGALTAPLFNRLQGLGAINPRLTLAEQIQIGSVQTVNQLCHLDSKCEAPFIIGLIVTEKDASMLWRCPQVVGAVIP